MWNSIHASKNYKIWGLNIVCEGYETWMNSSRNQIYKRKKWAEPEASSLSKFSLLHSQASHRPEQQNEIRGYGNGENQVWGMPFCVLSVRNCQRLKWPFLLLCTVTEPSEVTSDGKLWELMQRMRVGALGGQPALKLPRLDTSLHLTSSAFQFNSLHTVWSSTGSIVCYFHPHKAKQEVFAFQSGKCSC